MLNCDPDFSAACVQNLLHVHQHMACVCVQYASFVQGLGGSKRQGMRVCLACYPTEVEECCYETVMLLFSEVLVFIRDLASAFYEILEKN